MKLPDYEVVRWDEDSFDVGCSLYTKQAYEAGKYAFVTDFVRLWALHEHGGIYMDTDVEVIRALDPFLQCSAFTGFEATEFIPTGIMGAIKGHPWIGRLLEYYADRPFIKEDGMPDLTTNVMTISRITAEEYGWTADGRYQVLPSDVHIFPVDYFCPKDLTRFGLNLTQNTHTIHHFAGSWLSPSSRIKNCLKPYLRGLLGDARYEAVRNWFKHDMGRI
jgi:hypothetical protein